MPPVTFFELKEFNKSAGSAVGSKIWEAPAPGTTSYEKVKVVRYTAGADRPYCVHISVSPRNLKTEDWEDSDVKKLALSFLTSKIFTNSERVLFQVDDM